MPRPDPWVIKNIIRSNFNESVSCYEKFEAKYGLFDFLTRQLAETCGVDNGKTILDIGCGTGTSSMILSEITGKDGRVIGVDLSLEMLNCARRMAGGMENIEFFLCDACSMDEAVEGKVDAVLYNASIFLIPEPERALGCAYNVLRDGGVVGMNYLAGVFHGGGISETRGEELFLQAKREKLPFAPYGRKIFDIAQLPAMLERTGFRDVREGTISRVMERDEIRDFYGIPAQSAGLYPRTAYEERLRLLDLLLDHYGERGVMEFDQRWDLCTGIK